MDTALTATASKVIPSPGKSGAPMEGLNIANPGFYFPKPEYATVDTAAQLSLDAKRRSQFAEYVTEVASRHVGAVPRKGFVPHPVSTDWLGIVLALRYQDQVFANTLAKMGRESGEGYLTQQRLADALPPEIAKNDLFLRNMALARSLAESAMEYHPDIGAWNIPAYREWPFKAAKEIHSVLGGTALEDCDYEIFHYYLELLFDTRRIVLGGPAGYSRLGALEIGTATPSRYGHPFAAMHRKGVPMEVTDTYGRPVGPLDTVWTKAKALFEHVDNGLRAETHLVEVVGDFLYDHWRLKNEGPIERRWEGADVTRHYQSDREMEQMAELKDRVFDWAALWCDWDTAHRAMEGDKGQVLAKFWTAEIEPRKKQLIMPGARDRVAAKLGNMLLAYQPRGDWDAHPVYRQYVERRRDPEDAPKSPWVGPKPARNLGGNKNLFDKQYGPTWCNDDRHESLALGRNDNTVKGLDNNAMTKEQVAAVITVASQAGMVMSPYKPNQLLLLDDPQSGARIAKWHMDHNTRDVREPKDHPFRPSDTERFSEAVAKNEADYAQMALDLLSSEACEEWRQRTGLGNLTTLTDTKKSLGRLGKRRQAFDAEGHQTFAAHGGHKMPGVPFVVDARGIDQLYTGIVLPPGPIVTDDQYRLLGHALKAQLGLTDRSYHGGNYKMDIFQKMDTTGTPPAKLDFADIGFLQSKWLLRSLNRKNPAEERWKVLEMLRYFRLLEMSPVMDIGRANVRDAARNAFSGHAVKAKIVDWDEVAAAHPELLAFVRNDRPKFEKLLRLHDEMMHKDYAPIAADLGLPAPPVRGRLLLQGARWLDESDFRDLPPHWQDAKEWSENVGSRVDWRAMNVGTLALRGPGIQMR